VRRRFAHDTPHEVEPVGTARQRERGLAPVLRGEPAHNGIAHIRRVRHDHVVAARRQCRVEVGADKLHPAPQAVLRDVARRHREGVGRDVRGLDLRALEGERQQNRKATRAGAEIERVADCPRPGQPRREACAQKLRDVRARHDDALVDVEAVLAEPRFVREVRGGLARADTLFHERGDARRFSRGQGAPEVACERLERKAERVQREPRRFVARVGRAVAVGDSGALEPACGEGEGRTQSRAGTRAALSRAHPG